MPRSVLLVLLFGLVIPATASAVPPPQGCMDPREVHVGALVTWGHFDAQGCVHGWVVDEHVSWDCHDRNPTVTVGCKLFEPRLTAGEPGRALLS